MGLDPDSPPDEVRFAGFEPPLRSDLHAGAANVCHLATDHHRLAVYV
jgi:hypothetical protein